MATIARLLALAFPLLFCPTGLSAQNPMPTDTLPILELQPLTVQAYRLEGTDLTTPLSISTVGERRLQQGQQQLALDEALASVPGVFTQNATNFAQDIKVSIRGFGARSAFGIRGIKILVDGFPESSPDGQAQVDAIDPGSLTSLQVVRSSTAGLYGNASGGQIAFSTLNFEAAPFVEAGVSAGSYGFEKYQLRTAGGKPGKLKFAMNGAYTAADGYRQHSAMKNYLLNGGVLLPIDSATSLLLALNYVNSPVAQDPGALTLDEVLLDRQAARQRNVDFDADENLWQWRAGACFTRQISAHHRFVGRAYHTRRQFANRLPTDSGGAVELGRSFTGVNLQHQLGARLGSMPWDASFGIDLEKQADDRARFFNNAGKPGAKEFDQTESFRNIGLFLVQQLALTDRIAFLPSLRFDQIGLAVADHFTADGDDSADRDYRALSLTMGLAYSRSAQLTFFANGGTNFETPTLTELANPSGGGGFNRDLSPQLSRSIEVGMKGMTADGNLKYELAFFHIALKDEFVPFVDSSGRVYYRNESSSRRSGVEAGLSAYLGNHFYGYFNYTFSDFTYGDGSLYQGKALPGLPRHTGGVELRRSAATGMNLAFGTQYVSSFFAEDANATKSRPYLLANIRVGFVKPFGHWQLEPFAGINNAFNSSYYANIRVNGAAGRFYEPGPGAHFFGGVRVRVW